MNFKTPFKVLTTAALIGTLSLSAVAPGAASAASTVNKVSTKAAADQPTTKIEKIIITKDNKDYTIDRVLYNQLLDANDASVKDATITAVVAADGTYYTREAYSQALAATDSVQEAFAALEEIAKTNPEVLVETIPGSIEIGEGGVEVKDPTETPDSDFTVTEIAAINGTQVEVTFNKAPKDAPKAADFQIDGLEVKSVNAKSGSDKTFVLTTTAQEAGKEYTVKYGEQTKKFTAVQQVSKLEAVTTNVTQQVGKEATVEYKVLDQAGKPVVGKEVYVRAGSSSASVGFPPVEKTVKSDENGVVKFTYTRNEATVDNSGVQYAEAVTAYVVDQPLVRESNVKVNWTVADTSRLTVKASAQGEIGHNTPVEYTIDAKDADNKPLAKGETINLNLTYANNSVLNANAIKVELKQTNGTWKDVTLVAAKEAYKFDLVEAGKATVRVTYANPTAANAEKAIEVVPSFEYAPNGTTKEEEKSVAVAPALKFVQQKATLTLEPVSEGNEVAYDKTKDYVLTAKDQFGNPFRGEVTVDALENADGLSSTDAVADYILSVDSDGDEVFEKLGTTSIKINFAVGADDKVDEDGKVIVRVDNNETNKTTNELTLAAFVDTNADNYISDKEANVKADKVKFGQSGPSSIKVESKANSVAINSSAVGTIDYAVTLLDKDGKEIKPTTPVVFKVQKYNKTTKTWSDDSAAVISIKNAAGTELTDSSLSGTATFTGGKYTILAGKAESKYAKVTVKPGSTPTNNDEYRLVVFADGGKNPDGELQTDEVSANAEFTVETAQLTKASVASDVATYVFADGSALKDAVALTKANTDGVTYTYTTKDQSGTAFAVAADTTVTWTVTNNTDGKVTLNDSSNTVLEKGETKTVSTTVASGASTTTLKAIAATTPTADAVTEGNLVVKAQTTVSGTATEQKTYIYAADKVVKASGSATPKVTYTGTVTSLNLNGDKSTDGAIKDDGNFFVINAGTVGDIVIDNIDEANVSYIVEGNTANEAAFEKAVKVGSSVLVSTDGTGKTTITLK